MGAAVVSTIFIPKLTSPLGIQIGEGLLPLAGDVRNTILDRVEVPRGIHPATISLKEGPPGPFTTAEFAARKLLSPRLEGPDRAFLTTEVGELVSFAQLMGGLEVSRIMGRGEPLQTRGRNNLMIGIGRVHGGSYYASYEERFVGDGEELDEHKSARIIRNTQRREVVQRIALFFGVDLSLFGKYEDAGMAELAVRFEMGALAAFVDKGPAEFIPGLPYTLEVALGKVPGGLSEREGAMTHWVLEDESDGAHGYQLRTLEPLGV